VKVGNPDGFLVSVGEEVGPEAEHKLGHDFAGYWRRVGYRRCIESRSFDVASWSFVHVARAADGPVPPHYDGKQCQQCGRIRPVSITRERGRCKLAIARITQTNFQMAEIVQERRAQLRVPLIELKGP
jgi:hypothetical protein